MKVKQNFNFKCSAWAFSAILILSLLCFVSFLWISYVKEIRRQFIFNEDEDFFSNYDMQYFFIENSKNLKIEEILAVRDHIEIINQNQEIHNEMMYGPVRTSTFIIVIQVHDNITHLKELVQSLKYVMGITGSLLVFCHDYYDQDINEFILSITFTKWVQIFYPYSTQLYPKIFPGNDPYYCTEDFNCEETSRLRRADYAQLKHFWWWQMNFVFDHLRAISTYNYPIVFLEEGQYILKDFLYMLRILGGLVLEACPQCEMLSFGSRDPNITQYDIVDGNVVIEKWGSHLHKYGLVFNRTVWKNIKKYSKYFCYFNDYNWDRSLRNLAKKRPEGDFTWFSSTGPRVLRIKQCDDAKNRCYMKKSIDDVVNFAWTVKRGLYPRNMVISVNNDRTDDVIETGHWSDVRDQELCIYFTKLR